MSLCHSVKLSSELVEYIESCRVCRRGVRFLSVKSSCGGNSRMTIFFLASVKFSSVRIQATDLPNPISDATWESGTRLIFPWNSGLESWLRDHWVRWCRNTLRCCSCTQCLFDGLRECLLFGDDGAEGDGVRVGDEVGFGDALVGVTGQHGSLLRRRAILRDKMTVRGRIVNRL